MAERDNFVVRDISRCMRELQVELEVIQVPLSTFSRCPETGMWEVPAFSSHASTCGDIFISWSPRFSPHGDTVNLSLCFDSPAILTLCVNPQKKKMWVDA